jgi:hypothetical protein
MTPGDIRIIEGPGFYEIWVDDRFYDRFMWWGPRLTWSQQDDVVEGYREGLDGW